MRKSTMLFKVFFSPKQEAVLRKSMIERKRKEELALLKKNVQFKGIYKGKMCFIVGNGPSLKKIDLSALADEITITVNQSPRIPNFKDIKTNYHVWVDENFFHLKKDVSEDMELMKVMEAVNTEGNKPVVFYKTSAKDMIDEFNMTEKLDIHYIMDGRINLDTSDVDYPITELIPNFATCIHYAILIAVYMGFKEIYLLGCDCTGIINTINARKKNAAEFEYAYDVSENEKKRMSIQQSKSRIADEFLWYSKLFDTYRTLYEYCKKRGVKLMNATEGSILEEVPRIRLEDIL